MNQTRENEALGLSRRLPAAGAVFPLPLAEDEALGLCNTLLSFNAWQRRLLLRKHSVPARVQAVRTLISLCPPMLRQEPSRAAGALELAVSIAMEIRLGRGSSRKLRKALADVRADALSHLANCHRVLGDLVLAEETCALAEQFAQRGTSDPWVLAGLLRRKGTLLRDLRRLDEAGGALRAAAELHGRLGESADAAKARLALARTSWGRGAVDDALIEAAACLPLVDRQVDPYLALATTHSLTGYLADLGYSAEGLAVLRSADWLYREIAPPLILLRGTWLRGRLHSALRQWAEASAHLERARQGFLERALPLDAALVSIDLALTYAARHMPLAQQRLAEEMYPVFTAQGIPREAAASFLLFVDAARQRKADIALVEELAAKLALYRPDGIGSPHKDS